MKLKSGRPKALPSFMKTRRVLRLALHWAVEQRWLEALLEEAHIKISNVVSDLLGTSARRMLYAVGDGETDPAALAALADQRLRATPEELRDAFGRCGIFILYIGG